MGNTPDSRGPKLYRRPMSRWWWLQTRAYRRYMIRELTGLFVGYFAIVLMWLIHAVGQGPDAYANFTASMQTPAFTVLNSVALVFLLYHAATFFTIAPTIMVLRVGETRVPNWVITGSLYVASIVLSAVLAWVLLRV